MFCSWSLLSPCYLSWKTLNWMLWVKLPFALETIVVPWVGVVLFKKIFVDAEVEEGESCENDDHVLHENGQ